MQLVPLQPVPSQNITVTLGGQSVALKVYQERTGLFIDVTLNNTLILAGVLCQNLNKIVRNAYFGFIGDLAFFDNQGTNDPDYTGLGGRYELIYLEASDLN